ncbi:MAG TPA: TolC family protein, partial [Verrucomicrobiae bacterium]|nr:TolC family protein [Verrucomicrobiae bacterium]
IQLPRSICLQTLTRSNIEIERTNMPPMTLKSLFWVAGVVLATSVSASEPARSTPLTDSKTLALDMVVNEVLSNNPSLKAARANWEAARERVPQARAWADPVFEVNSLADRFVHQSPNAMIDQELMLEQQVPLSGKNRLQGEAAAADAVVSFEEFRRERLDAVKKARIAYFQLANAYEQLDVNGRNVALLKQFVEISRDKFKVGAHSESDALNAETALAKLEEDAADIHREISEAQIDLNRLMDRPPREGLPRPTEMVFERVNLSLESVQALALTNRPEMFMAKQKVEAARARVSAARREWIPDPVFRVGADRYNDGTTAIGEVNAGFSIALPWLNRSRRKAAIRENEKMLESAEQGLKAAREETLSMVQKQFIELETFHHHTELYKTKLLPLARQTASARLSGYQSDRENFLEVLAAQEKAQEVEAMYWEHLMRYHIALAELESITGTSLGAAMNTPSEHHHD